MSSAWATTALAADMKPTGSVFVIFSVAAVGSRNNPVHPLLASERAPAAVLVVIAFGYVRKYPEVVLLRR